MDGGGSGVDYDHDHDKAFSITSPPQEALRQLRERLIRDRDEAVERERLVGVAKAREAVERAEHAAEMQRLRTKADAESRLEEMERCLREEVKNRDNIERSAKRVGMEQVG